LYAIVAAILRELDEDLRPFDEECVLFLYLMDFGILDITPT